MYRWFVARIVRRVFAANSRGAWEVAFGMFAKNLYFRYPGEHALSAEIHRKSEMVEWLERIKALFPKLTFEIEQVVVSGWPWDTKACTCFTACYTLPDGEKVRSPGMQYLQICWSKVKVDNLYLDTQLIASLLERTIALRPAVAERAGTLPGPTAARVAPTASGP
jgi:ketosteroid isomerase-like protein